MNAMDEAARRRRAKCDAVRLASRRMASFALGMCAHDVIENLIRYHGPGA
jgi:hypothetical protein